MMEDVMKLIRRPRAERSGIWFSKHYLKSSVIASSFQRSSMRSWFLLHGGAASASCLPSCCSSGLIGHGLSKSRAGRLFCISTIQFSHSVMFTSLWTWSPPWTAARQASLSVTNSQSLLKLISIYLVIPSNHLIPVVPFFSCLQSLPASESFQ